MRRALLLVVLVSTLAACATASYDRRTISSSEIWWELRSPHFIMRTDIGREAAVERITELEGQFWALVEVYRQLLPDDAFSPPEDVALVVVFEDCAPITELAGGQVVGFATRAVDFTERRVMVTCEGERYASERFMHELTHTFDFHAFGQLPVWLEEGLASYFETIAVDGNQVAIGRPSLLVLSLHGHETTLPAIDKLLAAAWHDFHYGAEELSFYLAARNLVSALIRPGEQHRQFLVYLHLIASGTPRDAAWSQVFGKTSLDDLGEAMRLAHTQSAIVQHVPHSPPPDFAAPSVARARLGDVYADWVHAELLTHRSRDPRPLLDEIDAALRADPTWPDADFWRAVVLLRHANPEVARCVAWLRAAVERTPDEERVRAALLEAETWGISPPALGEETTSTPPARLTAAEPEALALGKRAVSAAALNDVAWYFGVRNLPAVGLGFARRALEREPECSACKDTLALLLAENRRYAEAVAAEEQAIAGLGDERPPDRMLLRLQRYRELLERAGH